ncbi:MAG: ribosome biogenesis factor YjgA [Saccharospirillum sp.]
MSRKTRQDDAEPVEYELVSKTVMKKEMHRLQSLGERLLTLRADQLASIPMTERLRAAIDESRRISSNEARRRHLQFIGKLMRDNDEEAIQQALDRLDPSSALFIREQQQAEAWRERLLRDDQAILEWFDTHPNTESQPFRAMIRASRKEQPDDPQAAVQSGRQTRKLLQRIRQILQSE